MPMTESVLLQTPLGPPGSGRSRYGAAMALHLAGLISDRQLEIYRIASARDDANPETLFVDRGLPLPRVAAPDAAWLIRGLVVAADRYLAGLEQAPGVAEVRAGLAPWAAGPVMPPAAPADPLVDPVPHPVVRAHLPRALEVAAATRPDLAAAIAAAAPHLRWQSYAGYDAQAIGAGFANGQAYALVVGEASPIRARDFDLGLFLIAPHVLYRDHAHAAPELYAPLTGPHGWRFGTEGPLQLRPAHHPVWNPAHQPHLIKVGPEPYLCLYGWRRDVNAPAYILPASDWPALEALRL